MAETRGATGKCVFEQFVRLHLPQLKSCDIPEIYWKTIHHKIENEVFDAGQVFNIMQVQEESDDDGDREDTAVMYTYVGVNAERGIMAKDTQHLYLIDHAWTYQVKDAARQLLQLPSLQSRMANLMHVEQDNQDKIKVTQEITNRMWRYNQTYQFGNLSADDDSILEPLWYVMDEFGSQVHHSDDANVHMTPFYHIPTKVAYTLMWPITDLEHGDEVTRDYAFGFSKETMRQAKLLPWIESDLKHVDWSQEENSTEYYQAFSSDETLPDVDSIVFSIPSDGILQAVLQQRKIRVFSDIEQVCFFLTDERFTIVSSQDQADILWLSKHFKDYKSFSNENPSKFINQFPCESIITIKDPLAAVARRVQTSNRPKSTSPLETQPQWLPTTFNLQRELDKFVSYYQHREQSGLDNHWIVKPWNLARGVDIHIVNNVDKITRLQESGPKVACKYIENPVLFHREGIGEVKFDIRYIVLLTETRPLTLYAYKVFWLRFANKPFSLDDLDDYEKHFTVMNYQTGFHLNQISHDEFIAQFERQYPSYMWKQIEVGIFRMFDELFKAATSSPPPAGIPRSPQSRAMYAVDLLLEWRTSETGEKIMAPMLCEVNYGPDCERACKYHPFFYNDVFSTLFLQDNSHNHVTVV